MKNAIRMIGAVAMLLAATPALAKKVPPTSPIDINRAGVTELMRLPGVGRSRAEAIVAYRGQNPFKQADEIVKVKGIGAGWFAKNKQYLSTGGQRPVAAPAKTAR